MTTLVIRILLTQFVQNMSRNSTQYTASELVRRATKHSRICNRSSKIFEHPVAHNSRHRAGSSCITEINTSRYFTNRAQENDNLRI